jgi:aconitate hydratase
MKISISSADVIEKNRQLEFERSFERLALVKWASENLQNVFVIPPFNGISHQTNVECLARIVFNRSGLLYPDTVVGTDSHTTMTNAFGVLSLCNSHRKLPLNYLNRNTIIIF